MKKLTKQQQQRWESLKKTVQDATTGNLKENYAEKQIRLESYKNDYNLFARCYFPHYCDCDCAEYHLEIVGNITQNKVINQFNIIFRGGAKSVHSNLIIPCYLLFIKQELKFMVLVASNENAAEMLLNDLKIEFEFNEKLAADFEQQMKHGTWEGLEFKTKNGAMFKGLGLNQLSRGLRNLQFRPDYISIDDVEDRIKANNKVLTKRKVDRITGDIMGSFSKDYQRLVVSNNLIHASGIIAQLIEVLAPEAHTFVTRADAVTSDGEPTWPERYNREYWSTRINKPTYATWQREYMNNPIEEGLIFKSDWIHYKAMDLKDYGKLICYGDLSYKAKGDYKALVLIGKHKNEFHILKSFIRKTSLQNVISFCYDLRSLIPEEVVIEFQMEASFMQDMFIEAFYTEGEKRGYYLNLKGDKRAKPEKFTRIESLSTLFERGLVWFNEAEKTSLDTKTLVDQLLVFEKGSSANDDGPDALEGGIFLHNKQQKQSGKPTFIQRVRKNFW